MLNKYSKGLFILVFLFNLLLPGTAQETETVRVYRVQFAASKTFIQPSYFEKKFSLSDSVKYFEKDGWYKYYVGDFESRAAALDYYHETGDVGYVIPFNTNSPEYLRKDRGQSLNLSDSTEQEAAVDDSSAIARNDSVNAIYDWTVRKADSALNAGDLDLARKLYREAAEVKPDQAYPMLQVDKIINMEAAELESGEKGISGLEIFLIGIVVFIIVLVLSRVRGKKKKPLAEAPEMVEAKDDKPADIEEGYLVGEKPFAFLDQTGTVLSSWDQTRILDEIREKEIQLPEFSAWLNSENLSILGFCLRMIRSFNQKSAFEGVLGLLSHKNDEIRAEAIVTLGELGNKDVLPALREKFESENFTNRILIMRAMARIPDESNIVFLKDLLKTPGHIQIEAAYALASIQSVGIKGVQEALADLGQDSERIARHILINKL